MEDKRTRDEGSQDYVRIPTDPGKETEREAKQNVGVKRKVDVSEP